jgi:hypothetical protein
MPIQWAYGQNWYHRGSNAAGYGDILRYVARYGRLDAIGDLVLSEFENHEIDRTERHEAYLKRQAAKQPPKPGRKARRRPPSAPKPARRVKPAKKLFSVSSPLPAPLAPPVPRGKIIGEMVEALRQSFAPAPPPPPPPEPRGSTIRDMVKYLKQSVAKPVEKSVD